MSRTKEATRLIWRAPLEKLVEEIRADAETWRRLPGGSDFPDMLEDFAARLEARLADAAKGEWVLTDDAAPLLNVTPGAVRARCRRKWRAEGKAEKRGGDWYIHVSALAAA